MIVLVVPYDENWPARYEAEANRIRDAVGEVLVKVHHIGSTSIPGLRAKPIVDILLEVSGLAELDARSHRLESLGYEAKGEFGIQGRRYFRRDNELGVRIYHVHAFEAESQQADRHLAFRDYLISHPQVARTYGDLKQQLAERFPSDIHAYMDGKDSFVKHYQAEALAWRVNRIAGSCGEA